jgi:hypothetical protein
MNSHKLDIDKIEDFVALDAIYVLIHCKCGDKVVPKFDFGCLHIPNNGERRLVL